MNIFDYVNNLTTDELRVRLAEYMEKDPMLHAPLVAVEVRLNSNVNANCRYEVLLIDEEGNETPVKFHDRYSRLIYIYTLLHPKGYQRRKAAADNYRALCHLYGVLYFKDSSAMLKTINSTDAKSPGHFMSQCISQARNAVRQAAPNAEQFIIDRPQSHNGKTLIPFAADGGTVILDATLNNCICNL
jgi:hypothetical protein